MKELTIDKYLRFMIKIDSNNKDIKEWKSQVHGSLDHLVSHDIDKYHGDPSGPKF